jgi:hypothetical protein
MGIKVVEKQQDTSEEDKYPYIGIGEQGSIVLFQKQDTGTVLVKNDVYEVGYFMMNWDEGSFTKYKGSITLENK